VEQIGLNLKGDRKREKKWLVLSGIFIILIFCSAHFFFPKSKKEVQPEPKPYVQITEGGFKEKNTFYQSLLGKNISFRWVDLIISKLKPFVDFKKAKGATYRFVTDAEGDMVKFVYEAGPTEVYEIVKDSNGEFIIERQKVPLQVHLVKIIGEIRSSLFEAMNAVGEQDQLALSFAEILACEIDFYQDVREKDRFKLIVEKIYKGEQFIQYGTIHAVEYLRGEEVIRGVRFNSGYYNEEGISLQKAFVKSPLRFNRISSRFSHARRHPILGGIIPHFGVDYAAPGGTPVWAVADGTVVSVGWAGGFGKQVVLRHTNGYRTYYGHLSRFGPGMKKGVRVKQKQIIGYVGTTGLSTGPHLDYRLSREGRFRNPLKEVFPLGDPIEKEKIEEFNKKKDEILIWLVDEVPNQIKVEETTSDSLQTDHIEGDG
jgi:murein DD-endopeptidase MepM/ murein hydrolase activator NlpD